MLTTKLLHPEILESLAKAGHGSKILIADGNYPFSTKVGPLTKNVYLNLAPGMVTVPQVLEILLSAINVESATVMIPADGSSPEIFQEFTSLMPGLELKKKGRFEFYEEAMDQQLCLLIATGEERIFANLLLTLACA